MKPSKPAAMICCWSSGMTEPMTAITGIASVAASARMLPQRLDAVDARQLDVHQDQVGLALLREPHAVLAGLGLERRVALELQHVAHQLQVLLVVFDDQDRRS